MALHGKMQLIKAETTRQIQNGIQRVHNQLVTMAVVRWRHTAIKRSLFDFKFTQRARPSIRALRKICCRNTLIFCHGSTFQIRNQPMRPYEARCRNGIFVFQYHGKRFCSLRRIFNFKRNRISRHTARAELAAALAVFVFKFAVDNSFTADFHLISPNSRFVHSNKHQGRLKDTAVFTFPIPHFQTA